jgi:hypothetical protein
MTWEEFIKGIGTEKKLTNTQIQTLLDIFPEPNYVVEDIETIAKRLKLAPATITANPRLGGIYQTFGLEGGRGKLVRLNQYLNEEYSRRNSSLPPSQSFTGSIEFQSLIESRTKQFVGREYIYEAFDKFKENHDRGYFTVVSEPGTGKTAIAANYVAKHKTPCYFNIAPQGNNTPEQFLKSIRNQLIEYYNLQDVQDANLETLLNTIASNLGEDQFLVIVVDALDEVRQEPGPENILNLPRYLPEKIYFFLTRTHELDNQRRLLTDINTPYQELDLRDMQELSKEDIAKYLDLFLYNNDQARPTLEQWLENNEYSKEEFKKLFLEKVGDNFMYATCLIDGILNRQEYQRVNLNDLPSTLINYYDWHWKRMGMDDPERLLKKYILYLIKEVKQDNGDIYDKAIAEILKTNIDEVQQVLNEWYKYFRVTIKESNRYYTFYHNSFFQYLSNRNELDKERERFREINQKIVQYFQQDFSREYKIEH